MENIFDDKMAVVNASLRGEERGIALPLLLDLARKPVFLHDNSVPTLDDLLNPKRGAQAPHAFYLNDAAQRADVAEFLRSLDTDSAGGRAARDTMSTPARRQGRPSRPSLSLWAVFPFSGLGLLD